MTGTMIGQRSVLAVVAAAFQLRHYRALFHALRCYPDWRANLGRYLLGTGEYPCRIRIMTPAGTIAPTIYSYHDMLTVNEVFCRRDYPMDPSHRVIVDIGANIGISSLYFLTRHPSSRCHLFEPVPENVERLRRNLEPFAGRFVVEQKAVADRAGVFDFGVEDTGRYGGLRRTTGKSISVSCVEINDALDPILQREGRIDILKIDTEGDEISTVAAIEPAALRRIGIVYFELDYAHPAGVLERLRRPDHTLKKRGSVCVMTKH